VNRGATVGYVDHSVPLDIVESVQSFFEAVGAFRWLPEEALFHPATALVGSGPAFMFVAMKAMADAAIAQGMNPEVARDLSIAMVEGSAALAANVPLSLDELRDSVASPNGTTVAGLSTLERLDYDRILKAAVDAAARRSEELAGEVR
jgi:pyrroline-5-carboxylate reductase